MPERPKVNIESKQPALHSLCTTFPLNHDKEVYRDHHLETFERVFSGPVDLLVLEGDEGIGKTTLLSQFARRHPRRVITSFVTPMQRYGYDPIAFHRDYSAQVLSLVEPRKLLTPEDGRDGVLHSLIQRLKRRHATDTYYFVLDGLTDISDATMRHEIARLLPIGYGFSVIVSGDSKLLPQELRDSDRTKTTQAVNFSFAEVQDYLADLGLSDAQVKGVYQDGGRGVPANLASIRRSLRAGVDLDRLIGRSLLGLYEEEWWHTATDELTTDALGFIAHSRHRLAVRSLSEVLKTDEMGLSDRLSRVPFIRVDPSDTSVSFLSRSLADYAAERLSDAKAGVVDRLVKYLQAKGEHNAPDAVESLPGYLQEAGRLDEVISFLSPDYFSNILGRNESFDPVRRQLEIGMDVASQIRQDGQLVRFGVESSAIREIETAQVSRSEIEALVTTDQLNVAVALAANCPLREDRLHLLAVIARCCKELDAPVASHVRDQVGHLHAQIDAKSLGDKAIDIAADLFPCFPDLAISLMEQSSWAEGDENELDIAYVRLSIATIARQTIPEGDRDYVDTIRQRIKNPRLRGFTSSLSDNVQSAADVIAESECLRAASDKLYVLRKWTFEHAKRQDSVDVAEHGLGTIVEATGYAPNARVLRELSTPLFYTCDAERARSLVSKFDGQRTTVDKLGPTEEVIRLQLHLAVAEFLYDPEACANRLVEVYLILDALADHSTRASCLARLLSALRVVDESGQIESKEQLGALCADELDRSISKLLAHTAEQLDVTRGIIEALAPVDSGRAVALAEGINTAERREEALLVAVDAILESDAQFADVKMVQSACRGLRKSESRDHVAASLATYLSTRDSGDTASIVSVFELFREMFFSVSDPMERCRVLCLLHGLTAKGILPTSEAIRIELSKGIEQAFAEFEPGWCRIDAGFRVARSLAESEASEAKRYLADAEAERTRTALSSFSSEWTYQACVRLAMRAFAGQLGRGYDAEDDLSRIERLIEQLPSTSLRAQLWGELAMHLYLEQHSDGGNRVVSERVAPLIDTLVPGPRRVDTIVSVAPALYRHHKTIAFGIFDKLESHQRDRALSTCAEFVLERHIASDPYESHDSGYDITYRDAVDVTDLAELIARDNLVYGLLVALADTLASSFANRFSRQQRAELVRRMEAIVDRKFPDRENIHHEGYAIASQAQLLRIRRRGRQSWSTVIERARGIPNSSDRAFVMGIIGEVLPAGKADRRESVFEEAVRVAETIPCTYDRLVRLNDLARMMRTKCPQMSRKCLSAAVEGFRAAGDGTAGRAFRDVIDTAFKIDPEFAGSLVSLSDDDPARAIGRHEMKHRLETLRAKQAIIDGKESWDEVGRGIRELPYSAWLALGSLNAGRSFAPHMDQLRAPLRAVGRYPLREGYPIVAWVISNAVRRFAGTTQSRSMIRVIFEGVIHATEFAEIAGRSASISVRQTASSISARTKDERMMVGPGQRDRALEFVKKWIERSASGYLYVCDQYFGPDELRLLMLVQSVIPDIDVAVLTSHHRQRECEVVSLADAYREEWKSISDQHPPRAEIVVVGFEESGKSPIHDRCILTVGGGISLGTSWNSLGFSQEAIISVLSENDASEIAERVGQYLVERRREYGGERLLYDTFTL